MEQQQACAGRASCDPANPDMAAPKRGSLGVFGLASLVFFSVAGSPAGSEDAVAAGGARLAILGFLLLPIVWCVPEALITAELATMFPYNGGFVMWVTEAFGETAGYIEGLLKWSSGVLDGAVYPVMMLNYVRKIEPDLRGDFSGRCFIVVVTLVLSGAQYCGLEIVGVSSNLIIVTTMLPFVVLVIWGVPKMDWGQVVAEKEGEVDWALLLTNLFWNLNYWDSVSTLAAEVKSPEQTFPKALSIAMVFTVLMYVLVLGVTVGTAPPAERWDNAELADAGLWVAGNWLRVWIVVSAAVSTVGLFLAELSTDIYQLEGMASMGLLPKVFTWKNRNGVPVVGLFLEIFLILLVDQCAGSLERIIAFQMVGYCAAMVLEFFAFVQLRRTHLNVSRPFKVPGGLGWAILIILPATFFSITLMVLSDWTVWVAGAVQVVFAVGFSLLCKRLRRTHPEYFVVAPKANSTYRMKSPRGHTPDEMRETLLPQETPYAETRWDSVSQTPALSPSVLDFVDDGPPQARHIVASPCDAQSTDKSLDETTKRLTDACLTSERTS